VTRAAYIVLIAGWGTAAALPVSSLYVRDGRVLGFVISNASVTELAEAAAAINRMLADGSLPARVTDVLPLEQAAEAHRRMEAGLKGRLVLRP
jgi:NADPH:quinone reductase-like Zn-dependent oxidoreductase